VTALGESTVRFLIADDYEPWRRFVCSKLRAHSEFELVGEISDGLEAVQKANELRPHLILLDVGLPTLSGIEAARRILNVLPDTKIIFVSENRDWDVAEGALRSGGVGYVIKSNAVNELWPAVQSALQGKPFVSAYLMGNKTNV
jgi:DNA-binding NarL/FixJ family response regulator